MRVSVSDPIRLAYDANLYSSFPDIINFNSKYYVIYREGDSHHPVNSNLILLKSNDSVNWTRELFARASIEENGFVFNCPKFSVVESKLVICCDIKSSTSENKSDWKILSWESNDGDNWTLPRDLNIFGMVPDRILKYRNKHVMAFHFIEHEFSERLVQMLAISYDGGKSWRDRTTIAVDDSHNYCEGSIVQYDNNKFICYMRNNRSAISRSYFSVTLDGMQTWSKPKQMQCFGHRFVSGVKKKEPYSGSILGTFRNTVSRTISMFLHQVLKDKFFVFTIDTESNDSLWDFGYTGWTEADDGSLMVVYYIKRNKVNPEICLVNIELN